MNQSEKGGLLRSSLIERGLLKESQALTDPTIAEFRNVENRPVFSIGELYGYMLPKERYASRNRRQLRKSARKGGRRV